MRIGLVLYSPPGYSETFFRNKIRFLAAEGIEVIIFANKVFDKNNDYKVVEGFSLNHNAFLKTKKALIAVSRLLYSPRNSLKMFMLNRDDNFTLKNNLSSLFTSAHILSHRLDWIHFGFATISNGKENAAKAINAQMAVSIRGFDIAIYPLKNPNCYDLLWKKIDKLHYISDDLLALAKLRGFDERKPHTKITPAIDNNHFQGKTRSNLTTPLKILTVARLHWKKGLEYTLEALSLLKQTGVEFNYTIIGEGDDYERLVYAAYQLGIQDRINFAGKKTPEEVKEFYRQSDIYLQYSVHEGFCNSVLEAQAMGLFCIVSDAEGLAENVIQEKTGWVIPKRQPAKLAAQISKLLDLSDTARTEISEAAMKRVKEKFDLTAQKNAFLKLYQN